MASPGYAALRESHGFAGLAGTAVLEIGGEDRRRFANGYLTCDVGALEPGDGTYGFFTSAQGRILADASVSATEDRLRVLLPAAALEPMVEHLARYVLADRVELGPRPDLAVLGLFGPEAARRAESLGCAVGAAPWAAVTGELSGRVVAGQRWERAGVPALLVAVPGSELEALAAALAEEGWAVVDEEALEAVRIEAGEPRCGRDFGLDNFPQETGLEDAVSYTKGCYLGQEVVARIHYRGQVNRQLRGLLVEGPAEPGAELLYEGEGVGRATSVVDSPALERRIALAILHRKAAEPGTGLSLSHGGTAEVVALPFPVPGGDG